MVTKKNILLTGATGTVGKEVLKQLLEKNVYSEIVLFEEEGHGFKNIQNKIKVLERTEKFLKYVLSFKN